MSIDQSSFQTHVHYEYCGEEAGHHDNQTDCEVILQKELGEALVQQTGTSDAEIQTTDGPAQPEYNRQYQQPSQMHDQFNHIDKTRKPCCHKETARCSVFLPTPSDSSIVNYIHCIKADVNVKL